MAGGVLNFNRYLNTLQTLTELGETFPSNQTTLHFHVGTSGTDGWTATIQWMTIILDQYSTRTDGTPDFTNSQVYGYYEGGSSSQASTGTISLPQYMYTGPILPNGSRDLPVTVVNISWLKDSLTYDVNLALIQRWEPGVTIGNPMTGIDFEPLTPLSSTLELTGPSQVIQGNTATFTAISDIPISLGSPNYAYLKSTTGTTVATTVFVDHTAVWSFNTLPVGSYVLFAEFGGIENYGRVTSNTLSFTVVEGVPLILDTETFSPSQAQYFVNDNLTYTLKVIPDPGYPPSGQAVTATTLVQVIREFNTTPITVTSQGFFEGRSTATLSVSTSMVDVQLTSGLTDYSITSYTTNTTQLTATILVSNSNTIVTSWGYQELGQYSSGSRSVPISMASTETRTLTINDFPITISQSTSRAILNTGIDITVRTTSTGYTNNITLYGKLSTQTSYTALVAENHSLSSVWTATITLASTGTWTIYAAYPGDFGQSISWANRASESNSLTHVTTLGYDLPATFTFVSNSQDRLIVSANTTTTLINAVDFYNGATFLGSATWIAQTTGSGLTTVVNAIPMPPGIVHTLTGSAIPAYNLNTVLGSPGYGNDITTATIYGYLADQNYDVYAPINGQVSYTVPNRDRPSELVTGQYDRLPPTAERGTVESVRSWFNYYGNQYASDPGLYVGTPGRLTQSSDYNESQQPATYQNFYSSYANKKLQRRTAANFGNVNPNVYRAWRYYDGTNYNLNTTTAYRDCLDPISTGTWNVQFLNSYEFGQKTLFYGTAMTSFADNSRVYNDNVNNYGWDVYDISRQDVIGDDRGYNVVGLNQLYSTPTTFEFTLFGNPVVYNWRTGRREAIQNRSWTIDLVQYLGPLIVTNPRQTRGQYVGTEAQSTQTVHLYRFTPEVRQTFETHRAVSPINDQLNQLPQNTYQTGGRVSRIPMTKQGIFRMPNSTPLWAGQWVKSDLMPAIPNDEADYGRKVWNTRNSSDSVENAYTDFCNVWWATFCEFSVGSDTRVRTRYIGRNRAKAITTTTNIQTATLTLSSGTVNTALDLVAQWPGTLGQPVYGNYNPFTLIIPGVETVNFSILEDYQYGSAITTATRISTFKPVAIQASIGSNISGQFQIWNSTTNAIIKTLTPINNSTSTTLTSAELGTTASSVSLYARFVESGTGRIQSSNYDSLTNYAYQGLQATVNNQAWVIPIAFTPNMVFTTSSYTLSGLVSLKLPLIRITSGLGSYYGYRIFYTLRATGAVRFGTSVFTQQQNIPITTVNYLQNVPNYSLDNYFETQLTVNESVYPYGGGTGGWTDFYFTTSTLQVSVEIIQASDSALSNIIGSQNLAITSIIGYTSSLTLSPP